jgi:DNA-binding transcriptional regulator YiaG
MTTNEEFKQLMRDNNLSQKDVSELIEVPIDTVKNWGRTKLSAVPRVALVALRLSIELRDSKE